MTNKKAMAIIVVLLMCSIGMVGAVYHVCDADNNEQKMATIYFDVDGGDRGTVPEKIVAPMYSAVKAPKWDCDKEGFILGGWGFDGVTTVYDRGTEYLFPIKEVATIKVSWQPADTIIYDCNDEAGTIFKEKKETAGKYQFTVQNCPIVKEGYHFNCWVDKNHYNQYRPGDKITFSEWDHQRIELVAVWIPN